MRIDLDANATTPVLPEVLDAMRPFFCERHGNPSSAHQSGRQARGALEMARIAVASLLHCEAKEIVFTSGGTESDNLALCGVLQPFLDRHEPAHLITTDIEHHAVLFAAQSLEKRGREATGLLEVTYLRPNADGVIDPADFEAALRPHTRLVSVMLANNETGAIQPVGKLARIAKDYAEKNSTSIFVHTDAVQGAGKMQLDLSGEFKNVDLLSVSGHKIYGPQGTGALFVRKGVELAPLFHGGPHERQRRAGTENVPGIVGLGRAAQLAQEWLAGDGPRHLAALHARFEAALLSAIPGASVNAASAPRVSNTTNLRIDGINAEPLLISLDLHGIAASFGSACTSGAAEASHVLLGMGMTPAQANASLRFSLSRLTTGEEIDRALEIIPAAVAQIRTVR